MRTGRLCALVFVLALVAPAAAQADTRASVHLTRCTTGSDASGRAATYQAWMDAVPGSVRMALRFRLVARYPGQRPQPVADSKLRWHRSHQGVKRYGYKQTVKELAAAGSYRMVVRFRWYDANGLVIRRAKRVSEPCVQRGRLPNLVITGIDISRSSDGSSYRYGVSYANIGKGEADNFSVAVIVDGAMADSAQIASLGPGEGSTVYLNGPPCRHVRATVDPDNTVPETNEQDNSYRATC